MAIDLPKLNFFKRLDARARVIVVFLFVVLTIVIIYFATQYFAGDGEATGASRVAGVPSGTRSIQGGELTPEYQRKLQESNQQLAQSAQSSGGTAVATMINVGQSQTGQAGCIICSDQNANVKNSLDDLVRQNQISDETSAALQDLANKNASISEYADFLDRLVKDGKLTPEQARDLLELYRKQYGNRLLQNSAKTMDDLIKSGQLPLDAANSLLTAQKNNMSPAEYALMLQQMSRAGKISPAVAQQLLAQYTQQRAREIINQSIASLRKMTREGQLMSEVERELIDLENRMVPIDIYSATLQKHITAGHLVPAVAARILDEYKQQKASIGATGTINRLISNAEKEAYGELDDLQKSGKISVEVADQLRSLIQKNPTLEDYTAVVNGLVSQNKLTPEISRLKIADYKAVRGLNDLSQRLSQLQANNASAADYSAALKQALQAGLLTPDDAAQIMSEYQATTARVPVAAPVGPAAGSEEYQRLQRQLDQTATATPTTTTGGAGTAEFEAARAQALEQEEQARLARVQEILGAMSTQAGQLVNAWQPPTMLSKVGTPPKSATVDIGEGKESTDGLGRNRGRNGNQEPAGPTIIKAGHIMFAVLDTGVDSDYPESPVMVTIVSGPYKGAKLMGKMVLTKGVAGQQDRVGLNFTVMNTDNWPKSKSVTAYGIDPDTARTVLASSVDYHYLKKYGAIMATSFLQGYGSAILSEGESTTGIFGTSSTHPKLSPKNKIAVALGQIGQNLGSVTQNYTNIPPTVKVNAGVGLGILFMSDVT